MNAPAIKPAASRWVLWAPLGLFALFVGVVMVALLRPADREIRSAMLGKPMPQFTLAPAAAGLPGLAHADLADGKVHLVNFFASWCVPCAVEAPQLAALKAAGVDVVGIAIRDRPEDLAVFLRRHGNPFSRIGADNDSRVQFEIGSSGVPESFVIDGKGVIRYQHIGVIQSRADIDAILSAVKEAGA
ncbi:redoxin family protein [Novosphingobium sp.]|uniref:redoxin family protein n=1 Tax=Novosphingobium sp. TaxID=1874826 RepID=UPI00286D00F7|nr:redoxin family protein [Novosphingobium sp.]